MNDIYVAKPGGSKNFVAFVADNPHVIGIGKSINDALKTLAVSLKGYCMVKNIIDGRKR